MTKFLQYLNDRDINYYNQKKHQCIKILSKDEEIILTKRFKEKNDIFAIKKLVEVNLNYIIKIAKAYSGYGFPLKDLIQEGIIGFIKSIKNFDLDKDIRLVSFAIYWIKSEIHNYVINNLRIVKIANTKSQKKLFFNLKKIKKITWFNKYEKKVISNLLNVDVFDTSYMEERLKKNDANIDVIVNNNPFLSFINYSIKNDVLFILENNNWRNYLINKLKKAIKNLDFRSENILKERWLLKKKSTLRDLSIKYNISSERVRQLEKKAINKIKNIIKIDSF